jgi:dihydroorotate dehydrogenase electron transfer subunit
MIQELCEVRKLQQVADNIYVLTFFSPQISSLTRPGQFVNIKASEQTDPLLRRPFSVYQTDNGNVEIIFNVIGKGTDLLHRVREGEKIDVLGPLGKGYRYDGPSLETAVLIGGGLGVAPLPILTSYLKRSNKSVVTFLGTRRSAQLVQTGLENVSVATDDGSVGFHGTVVDLAMKSLTARPLHKAGIFACGPTPMLRATIRLAMKLGIVCEVSLEGPMGCGFGICQGCPVETLDEARKYALMCKDGPVFDAARIRI